MKKVLSVALSVSMIACLTACGGSSKPAETTAAPATTAAATEAAKETATEAAATEVSYPQIEWNLAHVMNNGSSFDLAVNFMADYLAEKSNGSIKLNNVGNGSMASSNREVIEAVALGSCEMGLASCSDACNFSDAFYMFDLPYLIADRETAYDILDGAAGREMLDSLTATGAYAMNFWENGFRCITTGEKDIIHPEDVKGLKFRTLENDMQMKIYDVLGAYATPMAWGDVYSALETGVVDGHDNPAEAIFNSGIYEVNKHIALTRQVYAPFLLIINNDLYESLDADTKALFDEAAAAARDYQRGLAKDNEAKAIQSLKDAGCTVNEVDVEEWKAATALVYEQYPDLANSALVKELRGE